MSKIEELLKKLQPATPATPPKVDNKAAEPAETKKLMTIKEIINKDTYNRVKMTVTAEELTILVDNDIINANKGRNQVKTLFVTLVEKEFGIKLQPEPKVASVKKDDTSTADLAKLQEALAVLKQLGLTK